MPSILAKSFINIYRNLKGISLVNFNIQDLEEALLHFLRTTVGYKHSYLDNMKEVEIYFENIVNNIDKYHMTIPDAINQYTEEYLKLLETHPLTHEFINSINYLSSSSFNIKNLDSRLNPEINIAIRHKNKSLEIIRKARQNEDDIPIMCIDDIDDFEQILINYLITIKNSNTYYNIFNRESFKELEYKEKIKMILEGTSLNLSEYQSENLEKFFEMYTNFIKDNILTQFNHPIFINIFFDDELYVMTKRSELWYETPYYLSFMLKNKRIELPNVRIGINNENNKPVAHIIATQTSQMMNNETSYKELQEQLKTLIPKDKYFRYYNPSHLISLIITFGLLKGLGIDDVLITDYMPFRYKKIQIDKQLSEEEANKYQTRLTTKNIITYMNLINDLKGIEVINYPGNESDFRIRIGDNIEGKNEFLSNLYNISYQFGKQYKIANPQKDK